MAAILNFGLLVVIKRFKSKNFKIATSDLWNVTQGRNISIEVSTPLVITLGPPVALTNLDENRMSTVVPIR